MCRDRLCRDTACLDRVCRDMMYREQCTRTQPVLNIGKLHGNWVSAKAVLTTDHPCTGPSATAGVLQEQLSAVARPEGGQEKTTPPRSHPSPGPLERKETLHTHSPANTGHGLTYRFLSEK